MKHLKWVFVLLAIIVHLQAWSQPYVPFPEQGGVWGYTHESILCLNGVTAICYIRKTVTNGDTTINGQHYVKLLSRELVQNGSGWLGLQSPYPGGFFRNDSANKKVYYRESVSSNDTLLYDFNLELGDTLPTTYVYNPQMANVITIDAIDSITFNGISLKQYHLNGAGFGNSYLIEGIGSTHGLLSPIVGFFEFTWGLNCYFNYGKMIFWGSPYYCDYIQVNVEDIMTNQQPLFYPNPVHYILNIDYPLTGNTPLEIQIINTTGQKVLQQKLTTNHSTLSTKDLSPGIYFVRIFQENKCISAKKLTLQ